MDNLKLMKDIPSNSIDLIYCDILYGTGRKFKDYNDDLGSTKEAVAWYCPRITEMKRILKSTGSIYLHCDFRLVHYLKIEMDKIFGESGFQNDIIWSYKSGGATKKRWNRKHDNILFYTKTKNFTFNSVKEKSYNRNLKPYRFKGVEEFKDNVGWYTLVNARDVWEISMVGRTSKERTGYNTQKPKELLERIIKASSNEGDLVADFFCGSGTTCVVAKELGRNYLGCDLNESAIHITEKRISEAVNQTQNKQNK